MSSDTFTTALFLITAVIAAGVLINAVFPVIYQMAGTFNSATHESDVRLRTDFSITTSFASGTPTYNSQIFLKNIGSQQISTTEIQESDVFFGQQGGIQRIDYQTDTTGNGEWTFVIHDLNHNNYWDPGETLEIDIHPSGTYPGEGTPFYFQFVLPNAVSRTTQFTGT